MILSGRTKIFSQFTSDDFKSDVKNLVTCINSAMSTHSKNKTEINYLLDYHNGIQPILRKKNLNRPEINNIIVVNFAQMITRTIVNYFIGTPIQYTQSGYSEDFDRVREEVDTLNQLLDYEDSSQVDLEIAKYQSICGTAYRIIVTNDDPDLPFEDRCLHPSNTFVVYENDISAKPLIGVTYLPRLDDNGLENGIIYQVFTDYGMYRFIGTDGKIEFVDDLTNGFEFVAYDVGGIPLIEYPNNNDRIGDWELVLHLMDAISNLYSNRLDDIEQVVQALLVFINAEIDSKTYDELRACGILSLVNATQQNKSEVFSITNPLDQSGVGATSKELQELLFSLVGIPSRENRSNGGGDTGTAVELRDGWADLENVVRSKEINFKKCEKYRLQIITNILNKRLGFNLNVKDLVIKFTRNKNNNLLVKTQSLSNLLNTKTLDPSDCVQLVDLVTDVNDYSARGQQFWGDEYGGKMVKQQMFIEDGGFENEENGQQKENGNSGQNEKQEETSGNGKETKESKKK